MPDKIKRKALEEQERKRQPEKLAELAKAIKTQIPERKIEWVDPPLHDPNRKPEMIPLPNYTGVKAKMVPLPDDPNEPIRMQKMPYLIDTKPKEDAQTGGMIKKPSAVSRYEAMEQKAREYAEPALFDAVSPFGKGLAKIIAISGQKPDEAGQLFKFMQTSEKDPESPYYRPYARPTNKVAMDELLKLGIDTSNLDEKWFNDNAWLMQYARLGSTGMPKVPTSNSSREETAAYYYVRLADSEGRTLKAETELSGLRREIGYWAGRQDRNYSDEEIISRIGWNKYPTLTMLREGQQKGRPVPLNRAIDFDSDTVYGMLWSARNGKTSGSSTIDAARYVLGEGKQFAPDEFVRAKRDLQSFAYNPYALGSTVDEAAEYFKVDSFDQKWLNDNKGILKSGNETAMKAYSQVYGAEQVTKAAEDETRKLSERIDARLNRAVSAGGNINANALLKDALFGLDTLQSMDEGLVSGNLAKLTRPVNYRWQDVASNVSGQVQVINARQNAPHNPAELDIAARNEEEKVIQGQGTLIQKDAVPKSYTSLQEKMPGLWAAGLTKNPLSAGWYAPAGGEQSGFGPDQAQTQAIADARKAGNFLGAAAQGYDALTGFGGDISKLSTNEGAVRMAIDLALDSAKAFSVEHTAIPVLRAAAARFDDAVNSILGIDPDAVAKILPQILFTTTVQEDIKNQASGTAGLVSAILRLGEGALKTVTDHVLGQAPTLQTVQNMFHILRLRDMEKGTKSEASQAAEAALKKTAGKTLQTAAAQTGHEELDDLTGIANQSSHNLDAILNRWGMQGVNYIGNLLKAGRGDLAAAITAMPTYAKSAIVAETNMRTFGLNDAAIAAQENALAVDMKSPIVVLSAKQIAKQQAVEARKAELTEVGAPNVQSILVQKVNEAGKTVNHSKLALNQAVRNEQTGRDALTKAQALFHKNMADTAAADTVVAAIDNLQKATDARVKAQEELKSGQLTLHNAQQKLTDTQKQATARLDEQAKQDVDDMRLKLQEARAKLMGKAGGHAGEQGDVLLGQIHPENVSNEGVPLAQRDGNSIIKKNTQDLGLDTATQQKIAEEYLNAPLLSKESLLRSNAEEKDGSSSSNLLQVTVPGNTQLYGLRKNKAGTLLGKENKPARAMVAAVAATDVGYDNGYRGSQVPGESLSSSGGVNSGPEHGKDGDVEVYWKDNQPAPVSTPFSTQTPSSTPNPTPTPAPTLTPYIPKYVTNIGGKSGYALNANAYPSVNESSLMPLGYGKQCVSDMGFYGFIYAGYYLNNSKKDGLVDCVGMNRLPGITWFSYDMYEKLKSEKKMSTYTGPLYDNASRKGRMTAEMEEKKFDGMQLFSEKVRTLEDGTKEMYKNHVVTYYKEITMEFPVGKDLSKFKGCKQTEVRIVYSPDKKQDVQLVTFYDVVVHISGKSDGYTDSDGNVYTGKKVDELNRKEKKEILIDPYQPGKYQYWCALDYIDYGDQVIPESNK